tara:strand:- start:1223 stop:1768 length:546 start_codon:yes stop_codon:yes gene_type:complete
MSIISEINKKLDQCFTILILDNEVTLDAFVAQPALKWLRLVNSNGAYAAPQKYPTRLTKQESDREEMNWDKVDLDHLQAEIASLEKGIDLIAIGNNASQGLPLAKALPTALRKTQAAIIYGTSLPEQSVYHGLGYQNFWPREELITITRPLAEKGKGEIGLAFINTIEHNEQNYHAPWPAN